MTRLPSISVVMPTYQRRESLRRTLQALSAVDYPSDLVELVLVCDGCTDGSAEMARGLRLPFASHVLEQSNQGPAAARNFALAHARGPLVLFLDDDVLPSPGLMSAHAHAHMEVPEEQRVVIGTLRPSPARRSPWVRWELDTVVQQYQAMAMGEYRPSPRQFYTGNASVALRHLTSVGGFDTAFKRAEDVELAFRLQARGLRFVFRPEAEAVHLPDRSFASWLGAAYQYGRNDVVFGLRRGRPDMLAAVASEFWERNRLNRRLVWFILRAPWVETAVRQPMALAAWLSLWLGRRHVSHSLCSALFNAAYWRGVTDELGGAAMTRLLICLGEYTGDVDWAAVPGQFEASYVRLPDRRIHWPWTQ